MRKLQLAVFLLLLTSLVAYAYDPVGVSGAGERVKDLVKSIAQPIGGVFAVIFGGKAFMEEHNRVKNILIATGGGLVMFWDEVVVLVRHIFFGG